MDPNKTLERVLDAFATHNATQDLDERVEARTEVLDGLFDLYRWVQSGGFLPEDPRNTKLHPRRAGREELRRALERWVGNSPVTDQAVQSFADLLEITTEEQ